MPVDHSSPMDDKKRRRGAVRLSCAECRRLKLRCDRTVPCSSCVKRGCSAICPDGSLTTGQGNRFVLATTENLHVKITDLSHRVRSLEDALKVCQAQLTDEPHPLLHEELLKIKHPLQRSDNIVRPNGQPPTPPDDGMYMKDEPDVQIVDQVGSLSVSEAGRTKYYGQSANSYYFLSNEDPEVGDADDRWPSLRHLLPNELLSMTGTFPMTLLSSPAVAGGQGKPLIESLYWHLPEATRAAELRDVYYSHAAWMYNCVPRAQFDDEIYAVFYEGNPAGLEDEHLGHRLAVLFMIFAIGSQVDQRLPAHNLDAEKYHQLARASLFGSRIVDQPTTRAVQALYLMVYYQFLEDPYTSTSNARFATMGMAVKLAHSIGLHRDSGKFHLDPVETERRRHLFMEIYVYDSWMALTLGRPPSIASAHYDIKPEPAGSDEDKDDTSTAYQRWKYSFTSDCMTALHDQAFGATPPSYSTAMALDRKLRAHPVPPVLQIVGFGTEAPSTSVGPDGAPVPEAPGLVLQRHTIVLIRESNLLYLHRAFFARAVSDHAVDPLGSPFGTSVIAAYRSAWSLIALVRSLHAALPHPSERMWFVWANLFSGAVILGSLVARCPSLTLAPSALVQLDSAVELFAKVAPGFRAEKVLTVMLNLREKAQNALNQHRGSSSGPRLSLDGQATQSPIGDGTDELSALGGRTRVVTRHDPFSPHSPTGSGASSSGRSIRHGSMDMGMNGGNSMSQWAAGTISPGTATRVVPVPLPMYDHGSNGHGPPQQQVHPNVLEYLRSFGPDPNGPQAQAQMQGVPIHTGYMHQPGPSQSPVQGLGMVQGSPTTSRQSTAMRQTSGDYEYASSSQHMQTDSDVGSMVYSPNQTPGVANGNAQGMYGAPYQANAYPTYFPVFDYGPVGGEAAFAPLSQQGLAQAELALGGPALSESPHSTWNAFVHELGV